MSNINARGGKSAKFNYLLLSPLPDMGSLRHKDGRRNEREKPTRNVLGGYSKDKWSQQNPPTAYKSAVESDITRSGFSFNLSQVRKSTATQRVHKTDVKLPGKGAGKPQLTSCSELKLCCKKK